MKRSRFLDLFLEIQMLLVLWSILLSLSVTYLTRWLSFDEKINIIITFTLSQMILGYLSIRWGISLYSTLNILFMSILLVIAFVDYYTKTIVTWTLWSILFLAILHSACFSPLSLSNHILGGLLGFGIYGIIHCVAKWIYKREAFGSGDVWLMCVIGLYLGLSKSLWISFLSFYVALLLIALFFLVNRARKIENEIPFGPSMVVATIIVMLWEERLMDFYYWLIL